MIGHLEGLSREEYYRAVNSGMFWELFPGATGSYSEDVEQHQKNPIRITVAGGVGVGKSVIIQLIVDKLVSEGFDVKSIDDEFDLSYKFNDRVALVAESSKIEVAPMNLRMSAENV